MDDKKSAVKKYGNLVAVTGKYIKDGKEKNRYETIGVLWSTPHMSYMAGKIERQPTGWDGRFTVFRDDSWQEPNQDDTAPMTGDEKITLEDIPF